MATVENYTAITVEAGADLSAKQYHFGVVAEDAQVDAVSSAGGDADGVIMGKPTAADQACEFAILGVAKIKVGTGGLTAGDKVQSNANGEGIAAASGDHVLAKALQTGAAGEIVPVLLKSNPVLA